MHDAWGTGPAGAPAAMQSLEHAYEIAGRGWSAGEIRATADAMLRAQQALLAAVESTLGPDSLRAAGQLLTAEAAGHRANG